MQSPLEATQCQYFHVEQFPHIRGIDSFGNFAYAPVSGDLSQPRALQERELITAIHLELWRRFRFITETFSPQMKAVADDRIKGDPRDWSEEVHNLENVLSIQNPKRGRDLERIARPFHQLCDTYLHAFQLDTSASLLNEVAERRSSFSAAMQQLKHDAPVKVHIYCDITYGAGTFGTALLMAEEITERLPTALVRVVTRYQNDSTQKFNLADSEHERVTCHNAQSKSWKGLCERETPDLIVRVQPTQETSMRKLNEISFGTLPYELTTPHINPYSLTMNAGSSFVSLPLSVSIHERRKAAQKKTFAERSAQRMDFLETELSEGTAEDLRSLADLRGFEPEQAIWSWAYFQDLQNVMKEMTALAETFQKNPNFLHEAMVPGGAQIIYFMTGGEAVKQHEQLKLLAKRGVAIISADGISLSDEVPQVPITIIVGSGFQRRSLNRLQSELLGSMKRSANDKFWIDYPSICTGNASWLEIMSSGGLWAHDGFDAQIGGFRYVLSSLLEKLFIVKDGSTNRSQYSRKADTLMANCLIGTEGRNVADVYSNLELKTKLSYQLAGAAHDIAMGKDIIRYIAWLRSANTES